MLDRAQVVQILRDGCAHMRQAFDIESINLNELISTALNDPKAVSADIKAFHGINFAGCLPLIRDAAHNAHRMRIISTRLDIDRIYARRRAGLRHTSDMRTETCLRDRALRRPRPLRGRC
jgi:hypothetical protein